MGQQQSKGELLYRKAIDGNVEAVKFLHKNGASLEWIDPEGKTPLIAACTSPDLFVVAETLMELGANVNAYRSKGSETGTPLHHAAGSSLHRTIKLLLSHGANPLIRNDNGETPLDIARVKGSADAVRAIESYICFFSGWLRELRGPGFVQALAPPQLLSRKIQVVIIPSSLHHPTLLPQLELVIYPTLLDTKPDTVIALWEAEIEEPNFDPPDPTLIIFDSATKKQYTFRSSVVGDKKQIRQLYNACKGNSTCRKSCLVKNTTQVSLDTTTSAAGSATESTDEAAQQSELAMTMNLSSQSISDRRTPLLPDNRPDSDANGWGHHSDGSSHNGWGPCDKPKLKAEDISDRRREEEYRGWGSFDRQERPEASSGGWTDELAKEEYNGWGRRNQYIQTTDNGNRTGSRNASSYNGWDSVFKPAAAHSETSSSGWLNESAEAEYNGWGLPASRCSGNAIRLTEAPDMVPNVVQPSNAIVPSLVSASPSAPPLPEEEKGTIHLPSADISSPKAATTCGSMNSSSCVICWEASTEGACIPCGHMAGCMACLDGIKNRGGDCPVCRAKIDQVLRIYSV